MDNKIIPEEIRFLTKEDILNLCDEAQKPTALGKLAAISLENIVSILDKKATDFYNEAVYYSGERKKWFLFKIAAALLCIIFCPKLPISHILFWLNLGLLAVGFVGANYAKTLFNYYTDKHDKVFQVISMIHKALHVGETETEKA